MIRKTTKQTIIEELLTAPLDDFFQGILIPLNATETISNKTVQKIIDKSGIADRRELVNYDIKFDIQRDGNRGIIFRAKNRD